MQRLHWYCREVLMTKARMHLTMQVQKFLGDYQWGSFDGWKKQKEREKVIKINCCNTLYIVLIS